jgi:hypothetical protein
MARCQLAGPAADVSKILYGENRKSYQSPNAQYNFAGSVLLELLYTYVNAYGMYLEYVNLGWFHFVILYM